MSLDIVEIALDSITDYVGFEKLASEIMRDEGYPNIKPLGGTGDEGQDAIHESLFLDEGRIITVFQYTIQRTNLSGKVGDTIDKLQETGIDFHLLVLVTPNKISSESQKKLVKNTRKNYEVNLNIYERKTLINRLADYSNGIFIRHFPDIRKQVDELFSKKPALSDAASGLLECAMLKCSLAFSFNKKAPRARKSILDCLTLGILMEDPSKGLSIDEICKGYHVTIGGKSQPDKGMVNASLKRLLSKKLVASDDNIFYVTDLTLQNMASTTIQANEDTGSMISDIIDEVASIAQIKFTGQEIQRIAKNTRNTLAKLFQLFGVELSNQVLRSQKPTPVYLDSSDELIHTATHSLSKEIGELLISVISETLKNPTEEQAKILSNWSHAYIGASVMNLDPSLKEFQLTNFKSKVFILDTDFILDCLVREAPISNAYLKLVQILIAYGCRIIIPESCIEECVNHARYSHQTYQYFGPRLLSLNNSFIDEQVGNVFVRGYYYAIINSMISVTTSYKDYLLNYYEPSVATKFMVDAVGTIFPAGIEIVNPNDLLGADKEIPEDQLKALGDELLNVVLKSKKAEYRPLEANKEIAYNDARLFLTAIYLNDESDDSSGRVLGGNCYIITASGRYLICSKKVGIRDVITTRPQPLIAIFELIGGIDLSPSEFVKLFENPLLIEAVRSSWGDVEILLNSGVVLKDKSIARLKWDLHQRLHEQIVALKEADLKESKEEVEEGEISDNLYIELIKSSRSLGYSYIPELDTLIGTIKQAGNDLAEKDRLIYELSEKYERLEKEILRFGKRKQKYLRKIVKKD